MHELIAAATAAAHATATAAAPLPPPTPKTAPPNIQTLAGNILVIKE